MSRQVQLRRGSTADHEGFTGAEGEATYDSDLKTLRAHDGETAGGFPLARGDGVGSGLVASEVIRTIVTMYQSAYDALTDPDPMILYLIIPNIFEPDVTTYVLTGSDLEAEFV